MLMLLLPQDCGGVSVSGAPSLACKVSLLRVSHADFAMGGDLSPPYGGGLMGGDKGPMGGDLRVIRDNSIYRSKINELKGISQ